MIVSLPRRPHGMWSHKQGARRAPGAGLDIIRAICRESIPCWVNDAQKRWVLPVNPWWVPPVNPWEQACCLQWIPVYQFSILVPVCCVHQRGTLWCALCTCHAGWAAPEDCTEAASQSGSFFQSVSCSLFTLDSCAMPTPALKTRSGDVFAGGGRSFTAQTASSKSFSKRSVSFSAEKLRQELGSENLEVGCTLPFL